MKTVTLYLIPEQPKATLYLITVRPMNSDQTIENLAHHRCTGCGACANICPTDAISMRENPDGFLYPRIETESCTNCSQCFIICPALKPVYDNSSDPDCYAVWANDSVRMQSSSGGAFSLLADYVLDHDGYVCGAAFDGEFGVNHIIINTKDEVYRLRGSKYVQSYTGNTYSQIKTLLEDGKLVLFSGCPCEVAGCNSFMERKYDNLITVDIFCHCTASPGIWKKYLNEQFDPGTLEAVNFRDKESSGWTCTQCTVQVKGQKFATDEYIRGFHRSLYARESCENCQFSRIPRQGDFTIGDWWGISKFDPSLNDNKGTSLLLANTEEKYGILEAIKLKAQLFKEVPLEYIGDNGHIQHGLQLPPERRIFLNMLREGISFSKAADTTMNKKYDVGLVGFWYGLNYGSMLTSYAMYKTLERLGYSTVHLSKPHDLWDPRYSDETTIASKFVHEYASIHECDRHFEQLNDQCEMFLVGSDTVWNPVLVEDNLPHYFLDFAGPEKTTIAYASSFGRPKFSVKDTYQRQYVDYACKRMTAVSVREDRGVELMREEFDREVTRVLDPVFLLNPDEYRELAAKHADIELPKNFIFSNILGPSASKIATYKKLVQIMDLPTINFANPNIKAKARKAHPLAIVDGDSMENWLTGIENATLVASDSFHVTCFSIILEKNFITIIDRHSPLKGRFLTLLRVLDLQDRLVYTDDDQVDLEKLATTPIDYSKVEKILDSERARSLDWLKNALKMAPKPKEDREKRSEAVITYLKSKSIQEKNELVEQLADARKRLTPLNKLFTFPGGERTRGARYHLSTSFIVRMAFRIEYYRSLLLSRICSGKNKQYFIDRNRAVKMGIDLLFIHEKLEK